MKCFTSVRAAILPTISIRVWRGLGLGKPNKARRTFGVIQSSGTEIENVNCNSKTEIEDDFKYVKVEKIGYRQQMKQMKQCFDR